MKFEQIMNEEEVGREGAGLVGDGGGGYWQHWY